MGVYKAEIVKSLGAVNSKTSWRNVYHLNTPTIADAFSIFDLVVTAEQAMHTTNTFFLQKIVSDPTKVENRLTGDLGGSAGDRTINGDPIPLWNVVDVLFANAAGARPERKYYRLNLGEGDISGSSVEGALITTWQAVIDALVSDVIALCAPNGNTVVSGTVQTLVGMRQLNWHRRSRPGFHRGYVPNA